MSCVLTPYFRCSAEMLLTPPLFPHLSFLTEKFNLLNLNIVIQNLVFIHPWQDFEFCDTFDKFIYQVQSNCTYLSFVHPPCIGSWKMSRLELTCLCLAMIGRAPQRMWRTTMWWWSPDCHSSSLQNTVKRMWCNSWWGVEFASYQVFSPQHSFACGSTVATIAGVRRPRYRATARCFWVYDWIWIPSSGRAKVKLLFAQVLNHRLLTNSCGSWCTYTIHML